MNTAYLDKLNEQQKKAVVEEHNQICIIAGAGCGKTRTLIGRIIFLISKKNIRPETILVLTFTKKAIEEIKKRVLENTENAYKIKIHNLHSWCFNILKENIQHLDFFRDFIIYDQNEQQEIIEKILPNEEKKK